MRQSHAVGLLILLCFALFFCELDRTDLWSAHEARAAQDAQRMLDDHSWGLPLLFDGQADLQKPPAFYWLVAGFAGLGDGNVNRWAVRLPSAVAGTLTVLMVFAFLARRNRPVAGMISGVVLASSIHFTSSSRTGRIDIPLTCAITAAILLLSTRRHRITCSILAGLAFAAAILLKGPVGVVLPLAVITAHHAWQRWRGVGMNRRPWLLPTVALVLGGSLAAPWFCYANAASDGEFFRVFFWHHNVERAMGDSTSLAVHPWWYYIPRFAIDFLPWTPLLLTAGVSFIRWRAWKTDGEAAFGLIWMTAMIGILSMSRFKRADYLLPAFTGASLFAGCLVENWMKRARTGGRRILASSTVLVVAVTLAGWWWFHHRVEPRQEAVREQRAFAEHIRTLAPAPETVLLFRVESHLLAYHLRRPIHTLVEWGELNDRLAEPGRHWFVTRAEFVAECRANIHTRAVDVVARSEDFSPARPLRPLVLIRTLPARQECDSPNVFPGQAGENGKDEACPTNHMMD